MSQVETQQKPRTQSRQDSPSVQDGQQKRSGSAPQKKGGDNRTPKPRGTGDKGPDRREGSGRRAPRDGDRRPVVKDSKTIYIGKVFTDDLDGSTIAEQLKGQRVKYLRDVLEQFGALESFDAQLSEAYALVTYETHKSADDALKALRDRNVVDEILSRVESKILGAKLPAAVVPDLHKYKYNWSDKQSPNRTAGAKGKSQLPKNVIAKKTTDQQVPSPTTVQPTPSQQKQEAPKQKKARKPKTEEETVEIQQPQPTQQQAPKQKKQIQQQPQVASPKTQGADDLQREAERARLTQDLHYLRQQQQHVSQELSAESDRCHARDNRINRLSEELNRVRQQEQFLESQLKAEQNWKQAAEDRIIKLTEEVNHFVQEQKQVEKRLNTVSQQLNANNQ